MPTAEEWQALASILTLIVAAGGIYFTFRQVKLSREANQRSAEANERAALADARAAEAAEADIRPYVSVTLELQAMASGDPKKGSGEGAAYIMVESIGRTPARNLTLHADPPLETSGRGKPSDSDPVKDTLTKLFSGGFTIGMLAPGQKLNYLFDMAAEAVDPHSGRPRQYTVMMNYWNADLTHEYDDEVIIDIEPWAMTIMRVKPLDIIARQIRRISEKGFS